MSALTSQEIEVLRHTINTGRFVTDEAHVLAMAECGLLRDHGAQEIAGGMHYFTMAQAGRDAFAAYQATLPPPPKLTRSQIRYRRFLSADCGMKFSEWLKWETWSKRRAES